MKNKKIIMFVLFIFCNSFINAQIKLNKVDSLGYKQGLWLEYRAQSSRICHESVLMKDPIDTSKVYLIRKINYEDGVYVIKLLGNYKDGLREGIWIEIGDNDKVLKRMEYVKGLLNGVYIVYWPNGEIKIKGYIDKTSVIKMSAYDENGEFIMKRDKNKIEFLEDLYEEI